MALMYLFARYENPKLLHLLSDGFWHLSNTSIIYKISFQVREVPHDFFEVGIDCNYCKEGPSGCCRSSR
jgi:hypothetical protein